MKGITLISLILFLISVSGSSYSQNHKIDSLKNVFTQHSNDTVGLYALSKVASLYLDSSDFNNSIKTANQTIDLAKKLSNNIILGEMYELISGCYGKQFNLGDAISYAFKALKYFEITGNLKRQAGILQRIGVYNNNMLKGEEALSFYKRAYQLRIQAKDTFGIAQSGNTIGLMLIDRGQFDSAKVLFNQALVLYAAVVDSNNGAFAFTYNCFGILYQGIAGKYMEEGKSEPVNKNLREALKYFMRAEEGWKRAKMPMGIVESRLNQANMRMVLLEYKEARAILNSAINEALQHEKEYISKLRSAYMYLSDLEYSCGNYKAAYEAHVTFMDYYNRITNDENNKKEVQSRMQYEFDKKDVIAKAEQAKKDALADAEIQKQKTARNFTIAGAFGLLAFGGYVLFNYRKKRHLEKQQALSTERLRISRELHDDIGSTLGSIAVYSDVAKNRSLRNENPQEVLSKIGTASRELIEKMSDIIWSLNPENENFEQMQNRMQAFGSMFLTPRNIAVEYKFDNELKPVQLTGNQRKNIFLIYKEAIHNIVKYSDCKVVFISLMKLNNNMVLLIKDDGKGFDAGYLNAPNGKHNGMGGNGIKNMMTRAKELQAVFKITSKENEGTVVELTLNL